MGDEATPEQPPEPGHAVAVEDPRFVPTEFAGKLEPNWYCRGWNPKRIKYCRALAGWGTSHLGVGRCRHHDGGGDRRTTHGLGRRYSAMRNKRLVPLIRQYQADPDALNISDELAVARALLHDWLDRSKKQPSAIDLTAATRLVDTISKLIFRSEQIRQHGTISIERVRLFMLAVDRVLEVHISDVELRQRIRRDISAARV